LFLLLSCCSLLFFISLGTLFHYALVLLLHSTFSHDLHPNLLILLNPSNLESSFVKM
jgi:hypothetical protein